jgi:hypothetical protein
MRGGFGGEGSQAEGGTRMFPPLQTQTRKGGNPPGEPRFTGPLGLSRRRQRHRDPGVRPETEVSFRMGFLGPMMWRSLPVLLDRDTRIPDHFLVKTVLVLAEFISQTVLIRVYCGFNWS